MRKNHVLRLLLTVLIFTIAFTAFDGAANECGAARVKDLAYISGVRPNVLVGYGLVVGLKRSGDKAMTLFTNQSLANLLERMGVVVDPKSSKTTNVAAVMVTAELPPFARVGNRIDATVASIGDATTLEGGVLLMTALKGGDGQAYAVAQGPITVGGFAAAGQAATVSKNHPTAGRIPNGVIVEREIAMADFTGDALVMSLKRVDFTNVRRIVERINGTFRGSAVAKDGGTIAISIPDQLKNNPVKFISMVENLDIAPDNYAKIVVDEKTGTVVIGEDVRIATVAIAHGNISVQIKEEQRVSQPLPFARGETVVSPETQLRVEEEKGKFLYMQEGPSIKELVNALNAIGVSTRDVISILQTIKASGALYAELEVI